MVLRGSGWFVCLCVCLFFLTAQNIVVYSKKRGPTLPPFSCSDKSSVKKEICLCALEANHMK